MQSNNIDLSQLERDTIITLTKERYIASNIWMDTPDSGSVFDEFFKSLLKLKDMGLVKEFPITESYCNGKREFFLSRSGLNLKEQILREQKRNLVKV